MTKKARKALLDEIEKWKKSDAKFIDGARSNCELCYLYYDLEKACSGCPVSAETVVASCNLTLYREWINHHNEKHNTSTVPYRVICPECSRLKKKELKFLRALLKGK